MPASPQKTVAITPRYYDDVKLRPGRQRLEIRPHERGRGRDQARAHRDRHLYGKCLVGGDDTGCESQERKPEPEQRS